MKVDRDISPLQDPHAELESALIDAFLHERGYDQNALRARHDDESHAILTEASQYASQRLAEVDCKAHYVHGIHGLKS